MATNFDFMASSPGSSSPSLPSDWQQTEHEDLQALLNLVKQGGSPITLQDMLDAIGREGIREDDPRLLPFIHQHRRLRSNGQYSYQADIPRENCEEFIQENRTIQHALTKRLVVPDFKAFCKEISRIFGETNQLKGGKVADYIPQLARVSPNRFAVSICTVDGQRFSLGDSKENFCLQSTCKTINYALAIEEHGTDYVHGHVGREPSGRSFNELSLNDLGLPHNPLINAGAIMCSSMLRTQLNPADRYDYVEEAWSRLCGGRPVTFDNAVYLSERETADRNFALAYFMRENNAFPAGTNLQETLDLYFQCCSISSCTDDLSVAAATLANAGTNPLTGEQIFQSRTIQHLLSLMLTCGMYDFSGEFAFKIGLPAKSGVSGAMMVVVPNVMGISIWAPPLDQLGNSVKGVAFCEKLIEKFNFHPYNFHAKQDEWQDPLQRKDESAYSRTFHLIYSASKGDIEELKRLQAEGVNLDACDYDGRTALHLAVEENRGQVVRFLLDQGAFHSPKDRWGNTPLDSALNQGNHSMASFLRESGAIQPNE